MQISVVLICNYRVNGLAIVQRSHRLADPVPFREILAETPGSQRAQTRVAQQCSGFGEELLVEVSSRWAG